jgi:parallel beta-helix repeat protein
LNYTTIQEAIDANETLNGQTIFVDSGEYNETVLIDKSIQLIGENSSDTIINATYDLSNPPDFVDALVNITAGNVEMSGFNLAADWYFIGISASSCSNITIEDNKITQAGQAIALTNASESTMAGNVLIGIGLEGNNLLTLDSCSQCIVANNTVEDACYEGIGLHSSSNNQILNNQLIGDNYAIYLDSAWDNVVFNNSIPTGGEDGIRLGGSGNIIFSNTVSSCYIGLEFEGASNLIYGNNFEGNYYQLQGVFAGNSLNKSSLGNYYSDYKGSDIDQDGIGDIPYLAEYFPHSFANADYYPLVGKYQTFAVNSSLTESQFITVISNTTVSSFTLNYSALNNDMIQPMQPIMNFTINGENGTNGFCRVDVSNSIMNTSSYTVFVDNQQVSVKMLPSPDNNSNILYFTYSNSNHQVLIFIFIPEFPFYLIPLLMIVTLIAVSINRRKC